MTLVNNSALIGLNNVQSIDLSANQIARIPDDFLKDSYWVNDLDLSCNQIRDIGHTAFWGSPYVNK